MCVTYELGALDMERLDRPFLAAICKINVAIFHRFRDIIDFFGSLTVCDLAKLRSH